MKARIAIIALVLAAVVPGFSQSAATLQEQVQNVYVTSSPSVVSITSRSVAYSGTRQAAPREGAGSGFINDKRGYVVTNAHVVEGAQLLTVTLQSGKVLKADIAGVDVSNDLAVLRVDPTGLPPPLDIGNSSTLRVGQFVIALGNPFGQEGTLTFGVISALGRTIESPDGRAISEAIQTDAPINPGNSGGPLLDLSGRVIGINSQILSPSGVSSGIGFAISANTIQRVVPRLISRGSYPHPSLGVQVFPINQELAQAVKGAGGKLSGDAGLLVVSVIPGGGAAKAGIRESTDSVQIGNYRFPVGGDVITAVNGITMASIEALTVFLETKTQVGDAVTVTVSRGGKKLDLKVSLTERPTER